MRPRAGFTLIELLVVMAVIMVLAGLLFPAFAPARAKGRQIACLNNLHQLGLAMNLYCQDNDGLYPLADWVPDRTPPDESFAVKKGSLYAYVRNEQVFTCPEDPDLSKTHLSFKMNELLVGKLDSCTDYGSSKVLLVEAGVDKSVFTVGSAKLDEVLPVYGPEHKASDIPNPVSAPHLDKVDILFMDGHSRGMPAKEVTVGMFHPEYE